MIVFTDAFTVGADVDIDLYPGTPNYAYNLGSGGNLSVVAARGRVEGFTPNTNVVARIIAAGVPTGNQLISATVGIEAALNRRGQLACRCATDGSQNFYLALIDPTSGGAIKIYRCDAGSFTLLASAAAVITTGAHTLSFQALGTGATVDLTMIYDGGTPLTYADTDAARKTAGPPGISIYDDATTSSDGYVDDVSVDDAVVIVPFLPLLGSRKFLTVKKK